MKKTVAGRIGFFVCCIFFSLWTGFLFAEDLSAIQWYEKGQSAQRSGDWYSAIEFYQEAVHLNSAYGDAWYGLAECSFAVDEYSLALTYLESADKYARDKTEIIVLRGFCYLGLDRTEEAKVLFNQVLTSFPNNIDARFGLAQIDILAGRLTGAETLYLDALKRQKLNRNALLAVSLVSQEMGKKEQAQEYINQALQYHGKDAEVQYVAGWISFLNEDYTATERYVRTSVVLNPNFDKSYELLAAVLFQQGRYEEAIDICDYRLNQNRNLISAWYLKGYALTKLNKMEEAYSIFESALAIAPEDELMRTALEQIVLDTFNIEDTRRTKWAQYHITRAKNYEGQYEAPQAEYEYKIALRLDPLNIPARSAYAAMLDRKGQQEMYLDQLTFISSIDTVSVKVADTIEAYKSLLSDNLASRWNVNPFYLDKKRWTVGLYTYGTPPQLLHAEAGIVTLKAIESQFDGVRTIDARAYPKAVNYSEAFRMARETKQDYFVMLKYEENERELLLTATVYSGKNGTEAGTLSFYQTGNQRFSGALRRMCLAIADMVPMKGKILDRNTDRVLVDLGSIDGLAKGDVLTVVKAGTLTTPDTGMGIKYDDSNVLGTVTITEVSENVSEGKYEKKGFYDRLNIKDEVVMGNQEQSITAFKAEGAVNSIIPSASEITGSEFPVLSRMLQDIYIIE